MNECKKEKNGGLNLGKIKALIDRELNYVSKVNFVMIAYIFFKDVGWNWWYLLAIPIFLIWVIIDIKYIMPDEFNYLHGKSPFMQKLMKK